MTLGAFAVLAAAVLTFVPMNFLHPVRVKRLRNLNLPVFLAWCAFALIALVQDMEASAVVKAGIAVTGAYLFVIGGIMQLFPRLGLRGQS